MTTAIFIDGAFFLKRVRHFLPQEEHYNAEKIAKIAMTMALKHLELRIGYQLDNHTNQIDDLYRIFFYDCPPLEKKFHLPISKKSINLPFPQKQFSENNYINNSFKKGNLLYV